MSRFWLRPSFEMSFLEAHMNNLLLAPVFVPIVVTALDTLRSRRQQGWPSGLEIWIPCAIWSVLFELVLPRTPQFAAVMVGDLWDVVYVTAGASVLALRAKYWDYASG